MLSAGNAEDVDKKWFSKFSDCDDNDDFDDDDDGMDDEKNYDDMKAYNVRRRIRPYFSNCRSNSDC